MDTQYVIDALRGKVDLSDLTVAERLAFAHEVTPRVERDEDDFVPPRAFVVPPEIERLYKGRPH